MKMGGRFNTDNLIKADTFCRVVGEGLVKDGLDHGDLIYVINVQALPIDEDDLYLQRLHIMGHRYLGKGELKTDEVLVIDPKNLVKVGKKRNATLHKKFVSYYAKGGKKDAVEAA